MIKTILFDFGAIFINLDKNGATENLMKLLNAEEVPQSIIDINTNYEQGLITTEEFLDFYMKLFPQLSKTAIIDAWNSILLNFPRARLEFIKTLSEEKKFKLLLLSNTNALHINWIKEHISFYEEFKSQFSGFYLSHEIKLRKPNANIFEFVLDRHKIKAQDTLFIDDTKINTDAAAALGMHTWQPDETAQDVIQLFDIKSDLF